jgi:hypothetical protein
LNVLKGYYQALRPVIVSFHLSLLRFLISILTIHTEWPPSCQRRQRVVCLLAKGHPG